MARGISAVLCTLLLFTACAGSGSPEKRRYEFQAARAEWLDEFYADKRACELLGGFIIQERHERSRIHIGDERPEVRSRYWCAR